MTVRYTFPRDAQNEKYHQLVLGFNLTQVFEKNHLDGNFKIDPQTGKAHLELQMEETLAALFVPAMNALFNKAGLVCVGDHTEHKTRTLTLHRPEHGLM